MDFTEIQFFIITFNWDRLVGNSVGAAAVSLLFGENQAGTVFRPVGNKDSRDNELGKGDGAILGLDSQFIDDLVDNGFPALEIGIVPDLEKEKLRSIREKAGLTLGSIIIEVKDGVEFESIFVH